MDWLKKTRIDVHPTPDTIPRPYLKSRRFMFAVIGLATVASVVVAVLLIRFNPAGLIHPASPGRTSSGSFVTKLGEHRCERLPDDSDVCLNTNSEVHYSFNGTTRNSEVVSGEASFVVKKDPRPFDVVSGSLLAHDLSTSFDVYKKPGAVQMTVISGAVKVVAPITLQTRRQFELSQEEGAWTRGLEVRELQQVQFDEATNTLHIRPQLTEEQLSQLLAWQSGRIDLNGRTLGEALEEFGRYQPISKFIYLDPSIREIGVGGSMESVHLTDFLAAIAREFRIHYAITGADGTAVVTLSRQRDIGSHAR